MVSATNGRKKEVDFFRGIAIFLMLWGHSIQYCCDGQFDFYENVAFKTIYSFHMPLFMMISGYLFFYSEQKRKLTDLVVYKTKSILYPILMCSGFNLLITKGILCIKSGNIHELLGATPIQSLWFLWSVIGCSLVTAFSVKASKNAFIQIVLLALGIGIVAILPNWTNSVYVYPYFIIGYYMNKLENSIPNMDPVSRKITSNCVEIFGWISCILFLLMLNRYTKIHYIYTSGLWGGETVLESVLIDLFRWSIGLFGSVTVLWLGGHLFHIIEKIKLGSLLRLLGKESLALYCLSVSLLSFWLPIIINKALTIMPGINWNAMIVGYNCILTPFIAILYAYIILLFVKLLRKNGGYALLFGK